RLRPSTPGYLDRPPPSRTARCGRHGRRRRVRLRGRGDPARPPADAAHGAGMAVPAHPPALAVAAHDQTAALCDPGSAPKRRYPLTAPAVSPSTSRSWKTKTRTTSGIVTTTA